MGIVSNIRAGSNIYCTANKLEGPSLRFGLGMRPLWQSAQERTAVLSTTLQENLAGIRVVKAFAREPYETERFYQQHVHFNEKRQEIVRTWSTYFPALTLIIATSTALILWFGGRMVIDGALTVGTLVPQPLPEGGKPQRPMSGKADTGGSVH